MPTGPFDDIKALIAGLAAARPPTVVADPALGRLGRLASRLSIWAKGGKPRILRPVIALYAASYAAGDGERLRDRLEQIAAGGATINALAQGAGAGLEAFDLAVDRPVGDMAAMAAMSERETAATMAFGMEALAKQPDLLILGAITAGEEAACAALALALFGGEPGDWTDMQGERAARAVARAREEAGGALEPLGALRQLGGREIAAMAGAILAARNEQVPVVLDGYGAAVAAAVLHAADPRAIDHVIAGDLCGPGQARVLARLRLEPVVELGISAGEGCGGAAALAVLRAACEIA